MNSHFKKKNQISWWTLCFHEKKLYSKQYFENDKIWVVFSRFIYSDISPCLDLTWFLKALFHALANSQISQANGFSPVCVRICRATSRLSFIIRQQYGQAYFLSSSFIGKFCKKNKKFYILKRPTTIKQQKLVPYQILGKILQ